MAGSQHGPVEPPTVTHGTNGNVNSAADEAMNSTSTTTGLSADEIALYDRQIRLWGAQAQERIRNANILLISLKALGTEIAKNLTLGGIRSLTIVDDENVQEEDLGACYFLQDEDVGQPRAQAASARIQELNPRVHVTACDSNGPLSLSALSQQDPSYYAAFDCVIACDHDFMTLSIINTACRFASRPFYAAGIHGFYGYIFADLVAHDYVVEREKSNIPTQVGAESVTRAVVGVTERKENSGKTTEIVKKQEIYCPFLLANSSPLPADILSNRRKLRSVPALLPCLRALFDFERVYRRLPTHAKEDIAVFTGLATTKSRELQLPPELLKADFLRSFMQNIGAEIVPISAFLGGRLSEDVINVLGNREQPIQNFALFDGESLESKIYCLYSPPPELSLGMTGLGVNGLTDGVVGMEGMDGMDFTNGLNGPGMNGMMGGGMDVNGMGGLNGMAGMPMGGGINVAMNGSATGTEPMDMSGPASMGIIPPGTTTTIDGSGDGNVSSTSRTSAFGSNSGFIPDDKIVPGDSSSNVGNAGNIANVSNVGGGPAGHEGNSHSEASADTTSSVQLARAAALTADEAAEMDATAARVATAATAAVATAGDDNVNPLDSISNHSDLVEERQAREEAGVPVVD